MKANTLCLSSVQMALRNAPGVGTSYCPPPTALSRITT